MSIKISTRTHTQLISVSTYHGGDTELKILVKENFSLNRNFYKENNIFMCDIYLKLMFSKMKLQCQ